MPDTSRRFMLTGLAVVPALTVTTTVAPATGGDPIFAAIARYRAALAALETIDQRSEPARYAAAEQEIFASGETLFATVPQTTAGARALADLVIEDAETADEQSQCLDTLKVLRRVLDRVAALSAA